MIWKILVIIASNTLALYLVGRYIPGFIVPISISELVIIGAILALLNSIVKPILKLILTPVIWLTLGIGSFIINILMLYVLDIFSEKVSINGLVPLVLGTISITLVNYLCQRLLLRNS